MRWLSMFRRYQTKATTELSTRLKLKSPHLSGQNEDEDRIRVVELVNDRHPLVDGRVSVHPPVHEWYIYHEVLDDVQHLLRLAEEKDAVPLRLPEGEDLRTEARATSVML